MAATVETLIWLALKAKIETLPLSLPVAYPKEDYTPVTGQAWIKVSHTLNTGFRPFLGNSDPQLRQGILQLAVHTPLAAQPAEVDIQYAGQIAAHFWANPTIHHEGIKVTIQRAPDVGQAYRVEDAWFTPVNVLWEATLEEIEAMMIIYSPIRITGVVTPPGTRFLNPSSFVSPLEGATSVFLKGDYPKIRSAYERAGVPVHDFDRTPPGNEVTAPEKLPALIDLPEHEQDEVMAILDDDTPFVSDPAAPAED